MTTVYTETLLDAPAELVWYEVQTFKLLQEVAWPVVRLAPVRGAVLPEQWSCGSTIGCRMYLFGVIPLGVQTIEFVRIDQETFEIQSHESSALVSRWDHLIRIVSEGTQARYSDEVVIDAGWLTPVVTLFARLFYRHRQRRWQAVAKRLSAANLAGTVLT